MHVKLYPLLPIIAFLFLWQLISVSGAINVHLFPSPTKVFLALLDLVKTGELFSHLKASILRVIGGLFLGSSIALCVGLLTGRFKQVNHTLSPLLHVFRSFPPVALIPLIIVWIGIGEQAKLFSISFAVFFPVWISTHIGAERISPYYIRAANLLTKDNWKIWIKVIAPASMPFMLAGIRTGIAVAFIMVFVSELAGASSGIGYLISTAHLSYRIDKMMVGLFLLGFFGFLTDAVVVKIFRSLFPWISHI